MSFLSDEQLLRWGQWWVDRRESLRRRFVILVSALVIAIFVVGLGGVGWWAIVDTTRARTIVTGLERILRAPQPQATQPFALELSNTNLFWENDRAHMVSFIRNPHDRLWARFRYRFVLDGFETPWRQATVFPAAERPVVELGISLDHRPSSVRVLIDTPEFHRVPPHRASTVGTWAASQNAVKVVASSVSEGPLSFVELELLNRTIYNLRSVPVVVILWRGESPVGVAFKTIDDFWADTRRATTLVWPAAVVPFHTRITAIPIIDVDDEENRSAF